MCSDTLSDGIVSNAIIVQENLFTTSIPSIFTGLFSLWDIMFYSDPLVESCTELGLAMKTTSVETFKSFFNPSKILANFNNNFDEAWTNFLNFKSFFSEPQVVVADYPTNSYNAGLEIGMILYDLLLSTEYFNDGAPVDPFTTLSNYEAPV